MPSRDPSDSTVWEQGFRSRYEAIRASIRSLQIDLEQNCSPGSAKKPHFAQLGRNVDDAWDALNQQPPEPKRRRLCTFIGNERELKALEAELGLGEK